MKHQIYYNNNISEGRAPGFLDRISLAKNIPVYSVIELTYNCNFDCVHCYRHVERRPEMTYEEICRLLDELADSGCLIVGFTGGEVFLRNDFFDILRYARKRNFAIVIISNASMITKENIEELECLKLLKLELSLYAATSVTYHKITRSPKAYKQVMNALEILKGRDVRVVLESPILTYNYPELEQMKLIAKGFDGGRYPFKYYSRIVPNHGGGDEPLKYLVSGAERKNLIDGLKESDIGRFNRLKRRRETEREWPCGIGLSTVCIGPYGDVYPCLHFRSPVGNIKDQSFRDIWRCAPELVSIRAAVTRDFHSCLECNLQLYCSGCPALTFLKNKTTDVASYADEACREAKTLFNYPARFKEGG